MRGLADRADRVGCVQTPMLTTTGGFPARQSRLRRGLDAELVDDEQAEQGLTGPMACSSRPPNVWDRGSLCSSLSRGRPTCGLVGRTRDNPAVFTRSIGLEVGDDLRVTSTTSSSTRRPLQQVRCSPRGTDPSGDLAVCGLQRGCRGVDGRHLPGVPGSGWVDSAAGHLAEGQLHDEGPLALRPGLRCLPDVEHPQ